MKLKAKMKRIGAIIYKNRSNIEFAAAILLEIGGTAVIMSKADRAAEISDQMQYMLDCINTNDKNNNWDSPAERRSEVANVAKFAATEYTKCYGIGVGMLIAGIIFNCLSKATDRNEIANLSMAFAGLSATFAQYRQRVIEDQGEEKDQEYLLGPQLTTVDVLSDGTVIQTTEPVKDVWGKINLPPHCIMFDETNPNHEKDAIINRDFLENHLRWLDERLEAEEFLWENDIRRDIGAPLIKSGWTSGIFAWKIDPATGDKVRNHLSFGLEAKNPAAQRFRDGIEPNIILQLNMEDNIMNNLSLEII